MLISDVRSVLIAAAVGVAAAAPAAALGHDHRPPATHLSIAGKTQSGLLYRYQWMTCGPSDCIITGQSGRQRFPSAVQTGGGRQRARIVIRKQERPSDVQLFAWHHVDAKGTATGPRERLSFRRSRRFRNGEVVARVLHFSLAFPPHDIFLALEGRWPDVDLHNYIQKASWSFHVAG
jgi:hypothetical protein